MKQTLVFISVLIMIVGCGKNKPTVPDPVLSAPEIKLFKQSLPVKQEVLRKAYKKISPKIGLANMRSFKGHAVNEEFLFDTNTTPFIEYRFEKPYIIKKIHLLKSGFVVDGDASSSHIKTFEILFLDADKSPQYKAHLDKGEMVIEGLHNAQASGFIIKSKSVYTPKGKAITENDIVAAFDGRVLVEVINTDYIYDIVSPVLSQREESTSNEELLKTIALLNSELFRRLREKRSDFNLPKKSVLYLPEDADMHYAVAHTKDVYRTGKYKTIYGEYKIFIFSEEAEFDAKGNVSVKKHKIEQKSSNRYLRTTTQLPEEEKFIDFSEGL